MGMRLRVLRDGTRPDKRLCDGCRYGQITKGPGQGDEIVICRRNDPSRLMNFPVVECSGYSKLGEMDEWDAKQIGWVLEVKKGVVIGFKPPKKEYAPDGPLGVE
jgi:hypothetical protein